jgi:predicted CXXCH cytochrome family protein
MDVEITTLTRRGAALMHRANRVSGDRVQFGRGTGNNVPLTDIRIGLEAMALLMRDGRLVVEKLGATPMRVNGHAVETTTVGPGDKIDLGPYHIEVTDPPAGLDAAMSVELVQPLGDAFDRLRRQAHIGLQATGLSKRSAAWVGGVIVAVLFLIVPVVLYGAGFISPWEKDNPSRVGPVAVAALSWNIGDISNPHRFFAPNCTSCHEKSFTSVSDNSCLACHGTVANHVAAKSDIGSLRTRLADTGCVHCHEEHRGIRGTIIREDAFCLECHRSLTEKAPKSAYHDIGGFPNGHPQFRATVVADAVAGKVERVELGGKTPPINRPGLKFSHAAHLVKGGFPALNYKQMACGDCHRAEPGGLGFQPVKYKENCQTCHEHDLVFEGTDLPWPKGQVPHGDDAGIVAAVWNFYAAKSLQGGGAAEPATFRRAAGAPAPVRQAPETVQAQIGQKAESALRDVIFDEKRGCGYCHYGTGPQGAFETAKMIPAAITSGERPHFIAPVLLQSRFLPQSQFDHSRHAAMQCGDCHQKRGAESQVPLAQLGQISLTAAVPEPLDIPGIDKCTGCHGGQKAVVRAASTCTTCHKFHRNEFGVMRENAAATH